MTEYSKLPDSDGFGDDLDAMTDLCIQIDAIFEHFKLSHRADSWFECYEIWIASEGGFTTMHEPFGLLAALVKCKSSSEVLEALEDNRLDEWEPTNLHEWPER